MAAAGTAAAAGCLWPPSTAIVPVSSTSSSNTSRIPATTDAAGRLHSAGLNGSARGPVDLGSPTSPPFTLARSASTTACPTPTTSCLPPASNSPTYALTVPACPCSAAPLPAGFSDTGVSGDAGDDSKTYIPECVAEGDSGGGGHLHTNNLDLHTHQPWPPEPPHPPLAAAWRSPLTRSLTPAVASGTLRCRTWQVCPSLCYHSSPLRVTRTTHTPLCGLWAICAPAVALLAYVLIVSGLHSPPPSLLSHLAPVILLRCWAPSSLRPLRRLYPIGAYLTVESS